MSDKITIGSLVKFSKSSWLYKKDKSNLGLVIDGPEPFGFNDRYLIHWVEGNIENPMWIDIFELEVVSENR